MVYPEFDASRAPVRAPGGYARFNSVQASLPAAGLQFKSAGPHRGQPMMRPPRTRPGRATSGSGELQSLPLRITLDSMKRVS